MNDCLYGVRLTVHKSSLSDRLHYQTPGIFAEMIDSILSALLFGAFGYILWFTAYDLLSLHPLDRIPGPKSTSYISGV